MEPIRALPLSTIGGLASTESGGRAGGRPPVDGYEAALSAALAGIVSGQLQEADAAPARRAVEKIRTGLDALSSSDCLETGMARLLALQARQANDRVALAKTAVQVKHDQIRARNQDEQHQIKKRIEEEKNKSFWSKIADLFKAIGALLAAASSIFTGPVGIAASALCVASIVVAHTAPPSWGQWVSLGLSLAAAALTLGSSCFGKGVEAATSLGKAAMTATKALSSQAQITEGIATVASAVHGYRAESANADIAELRLLREKLQAEAKEEKEMIKVLTEGLQRGTQAVVKALNNHSRAALAACKAGT